MTAENYVPDDLGSERESVPAHARDDGLRTDGSGSEEGGSEHQGEYDGEVREIPFNDARRMLQGEADELMRVAREQLWENYQKKGDGWQYEEARYHFWKGIDEMYSACHAVKQGDIETMERQIADGWNHILMASYVAYGEDGDRDE